MGGHCYTREYSMVATNTIFTELLTSLMGSIVKLDKFYTDSYN